jgi:hypothetical protein
MKLLTTFSKKTNQELVIILESGDDYTKSAKDATLTIIELREIDTEELKKHAFSYWENRISDNIKSLMLVKEKPKSYFLTDEEITSLFKKGYENWKENLKTFEIDTTKYWFV